MPNQTRRRKTLSDPIQNPEEEDETDEKESRSYRLQPRNPGVERKSMVRFKDLPKDTESPIIRRQPPRRSLIPIAASSVAPGVRSAPFLTKKPKKGQFLVTSHRQPKTYSIAVKKRQFDEIDWKVVTLCHRKI